MTVQKAFDELFSREHQHLQADVERAQYIKDRIPKDVQTVLDIGCGSGIVTRRVAECCRTQGLELSRVGARKVAELRIPCIQASIAAIPFVNRSFDLVMANEVLEHLDLETFAQGIRQIDRVTRRYILITVPNRDHLPSLRQECPSCRTWSVPWGHLRSFNRTNLETLFAGFKLRLVEEFGPWVPDQTKLITKLLGWPRRLRNPLRPGMRCPVCGYTVAGEKRKRPALRDFVTRPVLSSGYALDALWTRLSPKRRRWLFALYGRSQRQDDHTLGASRS